MPAVTPVSRLHTSLSETLGVFIDVDALGALNAAIARKGVGGALLSLGAGVLPDVALVRDASAGEPEVRIGTPNGGSSVSGGGDGGVTPFGGRVSIVETQTPGAKKGKRESNDDQIAHIHKSTPQAES
jgi:hypothetical protein